MRVTVAVCALLLAAGLSTAHAGETLANDMPTDKSSGVIIMPLLSTTTTASGQPIDVPAHPEVVVSRYEIAPRAALPLHKHPYPRYAYVLSGTLEVTVAGGKTYRYETGDFLVEVVNQWHTGKNAGATPVKLLVVDQVVPGQSNTITASHN